MFKKMVFFFVLMNAVIGGGHILAASNYEVEPNNTIQQATPITVNQEYFGTLSAYNDNDYYSFTVNKPGNLTISMPNTTNSSWEISVYDSKGKELNNFSTTYGSFATGKTNDQVGLSAGTYYIKINNYTSATNVSYSFNASFVASNLYEQEPNNNVTTATLVNVNNTYKGSLQYYNDSDYYKVILSKPGNLTMSMPSSVTASWENTIYDSTGKELNSFSTNYGSFATGNTIDQIGLPAGTYYIKINSYTSARKVPYSLDIRFDQSSFFEQEKNNSFQEADLIQYNYKYQGVIGSNSDSDYYQFKVSKLGNYSLSIPNSKDASWYAEVYTDKGDRLYRFRTDYGSFATGNTTETMGLTAGTYYLKISNYTSARKKPYSFVLSSRKFQDVNVDFWGYNEITFLYNKSIISGYNNNTFKPNNNVTRAQAAIMISRALNLNVKNVSNPGYKDVNTSFHAYKEIAAVTNAGIFPKSTNFNPNSALTRGDMAMALVKAYKLEGTYNGKITDVSDPTTLKYVQALAANNITNIYSDNTFKPKNSVTRAQFSAFFTRILSEEYRK